MNATPTCNFEYFNGFPVDIKVSCIKIAYPESAKTYKMDNKVGKVDIVYRSR